MSFRFAVLTAVSSEQQATEDKDSLNRQLRNSRAHGERYGGTFVREYRIDGYSRADYWDLSRAFQDIAEFGEMGRDAATHHFDALIVESFDRLGDLGFACFNYLKSYRIQLRNIQLPIEDPRTYDPRKDDITSTMIASGMTVQTYRINKISLAFDTGNRKRARDGKPSNRVPYGYRKINKDAIEIDPEVAPLIKELAAMYLRGSTMSELVRYANESGVPAREGGRWWDHVIEVMLKNPFYAGKTFYKRWAADEKGHYRQREDFTELHDGKHEPMWTYDMHLQLVAEFKRRHREIMQPRDYNLTGLIKCSECGETLHMTYNPKAPQHKYWRCDNKHISIKAEQANRMIADELVALLKDKEYTHNPEQATRDNVEKRLKDIERQIARLDHAYSLGSHTPEEYADERRKLLAKREELHDEEKQKRDAQRRLNEYDQIVINMRTIVDNLHGWIAEWNPREVKYNIGRYVALTAYPDGKIKAERKNPLV